ncbi:TPA: hypothetical protein ACJLZL_002062, partial [Neisseria meningitidis]
AFIARHFPAFEKNVKTDWRGGGMPMQQFYVLGYEDNRYNHNFTVCTEKTDALESPYLPHMVEGLAHSCHDSPFLPAFSVVRGGND